MEEWSDTIRARLLNVHDLPAAEAVYHQTCSVNFRTKRKLPKVFEGDEQPAVKKRKVGRPQDEEKREALFLTVTFSCRSAVSDVVAAGEKALVALFCGVGLYSLRCQRYFEKLATKTSHIQPQNIPPAAAAARFHSLCVYLQVKQWLGEDAEMLIEDWGWKVIGDQLAPIARTCRLRQARFYS